MPVAGEIARFTSVVATVELANCGQALAEGHVSVDGGSVTLAGGTAPDGHGGTAVTYHS